MNLIEGLNQELVRAKELLTVYESIPTGGFGAMIIRKTIEDAESNMNCGNTVGMLRAYGKLERLE